VAALDVGATNVRAVPVPPTISGTFAVRVTAGNSEGPSLASLPFTFTVVGLTAPAPPTLTAAQVATNPVDLSWAPGAGGGAPDGYVIQAGTSTGASDLASANLGLTTTLSAVAPLGVRLFVRVVARNAVGSAASNEISFTVAPPSAPVLQPAVVTGSTVDLTWSGPPAASYVLRVRTSPNGTVIASVPVGTVTAITVPAVASGTYYVTVVAALGGTTSAESNQIVVVVP
jgi:hypothetical protein